MESQQFDLRILETRNVLVHSCLPEYAPVPRNCMVAKERYVPEKMRPDGKPDLNWFWRLEPCTCRKHVSLSEAQEFETFGTAKLIYKVKNKRLEIDETQIYKPVEKRQTPRIDLPNAIDIERAYCDNQRRFQMMVEYDHACAMGFRDKLFTEFVPDPFEGRVLFPFGADQRTFTGQRN